jgi:hypothetical protein
MNNSTVISFNVGTTDPMAKLGLEVWIDDQQLYNNSNVDFDSESMSFEIPDADGDHKLRFIMKNKTSEHTKIDHAGNILADARLTLDNLAFDDLKLGQLFFDHAVYTHNFNGNGDEIQDKFFGELGCNGTVSLTFSTPIYLWLLEHM